MPEDKFFETARNAHNKKDVNAFHEGYKRRRIYEKALVILEELSKSMSFIEEQKEQNGKI